MFCERRGDKLHIRILEPILRRPDDDAAALTARLTADIEEQIRRVPEQWYGCTAAGGSARSGKCSGMKRRRGERSSWSGSGERRS